MNRKPNRPRWHWRSELKKEDADALLTWVNATGLENVARIIATLTKPDGERGPPEKPETLLLLKIAHLKHQQPARRLHSIAREVADYVDPHRKHISKESLVSKLERDFRKQRWTWMNLASTTAVPNDEIIKSSAARPLSSNERRVLARLITVLPTALDLYDRLKRDAKELGTTQEAIVRFVGREHAEPMLIDAIQRQQSGLPGASFVTNSSGVRIIPRNLYDLVEAELHRFKKVKLEARSGLVGRD